MLAYFFVFGCFCLFLDVLVVETNVRVQFQLLGFIQSNQQLITEGLLHGSQTRILTVTAVESLFVRLQW